MKKIIINISKIIFCMINLSCISTYVSIPLLRDNFYSEHSHWNYGVQSTPEAIEYCNRYSFHCTTQNMKGYSKKIDMKYNLHSTQATIKDQEGVELVIVDLATQDINAFIRDIFGSDVENLNLQDPINRSTLYRLLYDLQ